MTKTRPMILIVDDESQIQRFLGHALTAAGYNTTTALTGADALRQLEATSPDLLILDLGLPDADGKDLIETIRKQRDIPIIVLSARDQEMERIMALDLGADDFVAKPFAIGELLARMRVCLRPGRQAKSDGRLHLGPLVIDCALHQVRRGTEVIHLTPKEFDLLVALVDAGGRVMTHRQLLSRIWGPAHVEDVPYLRVFIGQLRQKIETNAAVPSLILTEPGIGYRAAASTSPDLPAA